VVLDDLPKADELNSSGQRLAEERKLDASILYGLDRLPKHVLPMDRATHAGLDAFLYDPEFDRNDPDAKRCTKRSG